MIIKFDKRYKRRINGDNMSTVLDSIDGLSAEQILSKIEHPNVAVDVFQLAKKLGIKMKDVDFSTLEAGMGYPEDFVLAAITDNDESDTLTIMLKKDLGKYKPDDKGSEEYNKILRRRQRFSVAHEIAHAACHLSNQKDKFRVELRTDQGAISEVDDPIEYRANVFAGELLMPKEKVLQECKKFIFPSLNGLSEIFDVSHTVVAARLDYLGISYIVDNK